MKKSLTILCFVGILLFPTMSFSQVEITVGPSFPVGAYLDDVKTFSSENGLLQIPDGNYLYGAKIGLDVGLKYRLKIYKGLSAFAGANMIWNPVKTDFKEQLENKAGMFTNDYEVSTGQYFHIPMMLGLNYTYNATDEFGIFAEAGCGVNLLQRSPFDFSATTQIALLDNKSYDVEIKSKYDMACTFGFQAGIGAVVKNRFLISVHYYGLGSAPAKGETTISGFNNMSNEAIAAITTSLPFLSSFLGNANVAIDGTTAFKSDKQMFSQMLSFTFGVRFGECKKNQNIEKTTVKKEKAEKPKKATKTDKQTKQPKTDKPKKIKKEA